MNQSFKSVRSVSLGDLSAIDVVTNSVILHTNSGHARVMAYPEDIIRISASRDTTFEDFSYSVIAEPTGKFVKIESDKAITLSHGSLNLEINRNPLRFTFRNANQEVLCEDDHAFGITWNADQVTCFKKLQDGERFIGLGEKTGPLDRKGNGYTNWNTDAFGYGSGSDPLYGSFPVYFGIHHGLFYGIFLDNTHKSFFNFGASNNRFASFAADTGEMNYYFFHGNSIGELIKKYTTLTGRIEMPPLWSIGYQQCRYSYYPDTEVLTLAQTFRDKNFPADTIVLDIHYMQDYKIFTWNKKDFSDPKALLDKLKNLGFHVVVMCDPGIKVEAGYDAYDDGLASKVFINYPDGTPYTGQVWPGWCHFPDFTSSKTRAWWKSKFTDYVALGIEGFWNDMNEIATWGHALPEHIELDFEGNKSTMRRGRNIYGMQMSRATYEGTKSLMQGKRPFNLTRSSFAGIQRYSAVWTGDNVAYDEHMLLGVRLVSGLGLAGVPFAGYDVGGFVGDTSSDLFARWISIGAFAPFFRGHTMINSRDSEPWSFGEEVEQIARNYIRFRYRLLPYLYDLFYEASQTGLPVQRTLAIEFPLEPRVYDGLYYNQFMVGSAILVAPVESNKQYLKVLLPPGTWYSLYNGHKYAGNTEMIVECPLHRLPVFVRGGSVLPMQEVQATAGFSDNLHLHIYAEGESELTHFEDDGDTFAYQKGLHHKRKIEFRNNTLKLGAADGERASGVKELTLIFHGFYNLKGVNINGSFIEAKPFINSFFSGLEKFDPIKEPEPAPEENTYIIKLPYSVSEVIIIPEYY